MWVSEGSDNQNTKGTHLDLSWSGLLSPMSRNIVIFVSKMTNMGGYRWWKLGEIGRGLLGAILDFVSVLPQSLGVG